LPGLCGYVSRNFVGKPRLFTTILSRGTRWPKPSFLFCPGSVSAAAISQDAGSCNAIKFAETVCCPSSAGPSFYCDYCDGGVENPDTEPFTGGATCADYAGGQVLQYISL
jgi:hypothetical protein